MATSISTLESFFEPGDKPSSAQFSAILHSYRHLDDKIAASDLTTELQNFLNGLGEKGFVVLQAGAASWQVPAGALIELIVLDDNANPLVNIGTTAGGNQIGDALQLAGGEYLLEKKIRFKTATTIYFSGITGSTVITIYKR